MSEAIAVRTPFSPRRALDRATGRVTMYRLVTLLLAITAVAAILLSLIGSVAFPPEALIASLAAALLGTVGANVVVSLALRTRPHTESSIITGLLVFFLMYPSAAPADLGTTALAGALATLTKYVLAWRGRHIFNPAAAGVALVAVLQLGSAVWWVATGALLPFVAAGAFLVLYRTRRMPMALVFVIVAVGALTFRLASGQGVLDALTTAFTSYPVIFFAGFMLSEPLTLPPRRWQQLALAVIVGVLFPIPFVFGPVFLSFEFALLVGNLLAFAVGQRRGIRLAFLSKRRVTPTAWEFTFQPDRAMSFRPGQYLELTVPHARADHRGSRRVFSIASAPSPTGPVTVAMRMPPQSSSFKRALVDLSPGARLHATSVGGDFLLPADLSRPVLLVAGGIGVTPFLSQLAHDRDSEVDRDVVLLYAVSSADELAFTDELAGTRTLLVMPEPPHDLPAAWRWVGPGPITPELIGNEVPDAAARAGYVSGSPAVVTDARAALRRAGVRRVTTDYFSGY